MLDRRDFNEIFDSEADEYLENENNDADSSSRRSSLDHDVILDGIGRSKENVHGANMDSIGHNEDEIHSVNLDGTGNIEEADHGVNMDDIGDNEDTGHGADVDGTGNIPMRHSNRQTRAPERYGDWQTYFALSAQAFVEDDPKTIAEAKQKGDWKEWQKAIKDEYDSLMKNDTWTVCHLLANGSSN